MGKQLIQNRILGILFWLKVLFSFALAFCGFGYMANEVYLRHNNQLILFAESATPIFIDAASCSINAGSRLGRLEPPVGKKMNGFHLNWLIQTPLELRGLIKRNPSIINAFLDVDITRNPPLRWNNFQWHAEEIARMGSIFQLTLEPTSLSAMPDSLLEEIALKCLEINSRGVPMFLRYGHEMNGDWTTYGNKPVDYVSGFRRMAEMIRKHTNMTAMVWAPNVGINYPFSGQNPLPTRISDPINFAALDTNGDNVFDWKDDPYLPYYPGDEYVDWVGISLYWYPDKVYSGYNGPIPPTFFIDQLTGQGPSMLDYNPKIIPGGLRNFYQRFAVERMKPLMIAETSAPYFDNVPFPVKDGKLSETEIKREWWRQLYGPDSYNKLPLLKAVIHFEERKIDPGEPVRDWRILANRDTRNAFIQDLDALGKKVLYSTDLKYGCDGSLSFK